MGALQVFDADGRGEELYPVADIADDRVFRPDQFGGGREIAVGRSRDSGLIGS